METTDYSGMFIYKNDHLDYILTSEGRIKWDGHLNQSYPEYFIKDHLGNVRSVITSNPNQHYMVQGTDYYPFGMEIPAYGASDNQLKYNSKELQTEADLNWYDYGARFYDPVLARWHVVDPLAEKHHPLSPYTYCFNNPVIFVDPDGKDVEIVIGKPYTKNGKEHPYGHMAIRVYGEGYNYVFDFGRYGKTWGLGKGEGIMNVYKDGSKYMESEQRIRESIGYNISTTSIEDQKVIDYYFNLAKEGEVSETTKGLVPNGGGTSYKLDEDYDVFDNNCVTKTADGLEQIQENKVENENDPRDVLKEFEANYEEMGFDKKTIYLEGGGTKVVYERKPLPEPRKKDYENHY